MPNTPFDGIIVNDITPTLVGTVLTLSVTQTEVKTYGSGIAVPSSPVVVKVTLDLANLVL